MEISVIIPCLNEKRTIRRCVEEAREGISSINKLGEVIVIDNGSSDDSIAIAIQAGARVIKAETKGYGIALRTGINNARGKYVIMADSDGSYDFRLVPKFYNKFQEGYDIVIGNRFMGGIEDGAMPFLNRYLGTPVLTMITRILFGKGFGDTQCGLRGGSKEALTHLNLKSTGFEFASEMIAKALRSNYKHIEIPVTLRLDHKDRKPHLRPWRDGFRHLKLLIILFFQRI
jgi:glycosyltransferase involved in cell wall biosynthesis